MPDLGTQLRAYVDDLVTGMASPKKQIEEVITGSGRTIRVRGREGSMQRQDRGHRWWWSGPVIAVTASLAVVSLGMAILLVGPFRDPEPAATSWPVNGSVGEWILVPDPTGAFVAETFVESLPQGDGGTLTGTSGIAVAALVGSPEGVVAVGYEHFGLRSVAAVWTSSDGGFTWDRVPHDAAVFGGVDHDLGDLVSSGLSMTAVTYGHGRFVAVGSDTSVAMDPVAWYSDDGHSWTRVPAEDGPRPGIGYTTVSGVVAGGPGFVAAGVDSVTTGDATTYSALVWTSRDGASWQASDDAIPGATAAIIGDLVAIDGSIVGVGFSDGPKAAAAWVSHDGTTWEVASVVDTTDSSTPFAEMHHVVATPSGAIAFGRAYSSVSNGPTNTEIAVWITEDGLTWNRVPVSHLTDQTVELPGPGVWGPAGLVSIVSLRAEVLASAEPSDVMWTSSDGVNWEQRPVSFRGSVSDLAVIEGRYVAVGSAPRVGVDATLDDATLDGAIWDGAIWLAQIK